jgi:hypothetical protein
MVLGCEGFGLQGVSSEGFGMQGVRVGPHFDECPFIDVGFGVLVTATRVLLCS